MDNTDSTYALSLFQNKAFYELTCNTDVVCLWKPDVVHVYVLEPSVMHLQALGKGEHIVTDWTEYFCSLLEIQAFMPVCLNQLRIFHVSDSMTYCEWCEPNTLYL